MSAGVPPFTPAGSLVNGVLEGCDIRRIFSVRMFRWDEITDGDKWRRRKKSLVTRHEKSFCSCKRWMVDLLSALVLIEKLVPIIR